MATPQRLHDTKYSGIRTGVRVCVIVKDATVRSWEQTAALLFGKEKEELGTG